MKSAKKQQLLDFLLATKWEVNPATGQVFSKYKRQEIKGTALQTGYIKVGTVVDHQKVSFYKHQIVARAAGFELVGFDVNHKNGLKDDNQLSNLEVVSHRENIRHAHRNRLVATAHAVQVRHGLDLQLIEAIKRDLERQAHETKQQLSQHYQCDLAVIESISRIRA